MSEGPFRTPDVVPPKPIAAGDVVMLKSGGPKMTVSHFKRVLGVGSSSVVTVAVCVWQTPPLHPSFPHHDHRLEIAPEALERVG